MDRAPPRRGPPPVLWSLTLGAVGFCAGFYGPIALDQGSNLGPLFGLFITGPGGLIAGQLLGWLFIVLPVSNARRWQALLAANLLFAVGTLYFCLPPPDTEGYLIEGTVARCQPPRELVAEGTVYWEQRIAGAPWMAVRDNWQGQLNSMAEREDAVVLTVTTQRMNRVLRHKRPWNRGKISTAGWQKQVEEGRYLANFAGGSCAAYPAQLPMLHVPWGVASQAWPPEDLAGLLHIGRLEPVR